VTDVKRYCNQCTTWYHENCLGEIVAAEKMMMEDLDIIAAFPIIRGHSSESGKDQQDWDVSGTGRMVLKAREWVQNGAPENWKKKLSARFVHHVLSDEWQYHICTVFQATI
jgi:hypothetical protein